MEVDHSGRMTYRLVSWATWNPQSGATFLANGDIVYLDGKVRNGRYGIDGPGTMHHKDWLWDPETRTWTHRPVQTAPAPAPATGATKQKKPPAKFAAVAGAPRRAASH